MDWFRVAKKCEWSSLTDVRRTFSHADLVGECVVFNIGGNKFRLITKIKFRAKVIYIRFVLTHGEYNKNAWKNDCRC